MIYIVGLPHTPFHDVLASSCAFTAKAARLARMFKMRGREVTVLWGGSENSEDVPLVSIFSNAERSAYFGEFTGDKLPVIEWDVNLPYWKEFNDRCIGYLKNHVQTGDIIALIGGAIQQEFVQHFPNNVILEPGVGYEGIIPWDKRQNHGTFACFESYAWMHNRYGAYGIGDGRAFDAVIPNAVDPKDFECGLSDGYALFVGRLIQRKGPHVAGEIARRAGLPLKMAGAGVMAKSEGRVVATDGTIIECPSLEHVGSVSGAARADLYAKAEVMLVPTLYIGPWEGVHAEALMSGVQVVAPDYGVFTETIEPEFRYRTLNEAVECVGRAREARGVNLRDKSIQRFGINRCADMYDAWLKRIESLSNGGWYA